MIIKTVVSARQLSVRIDEATDMHHTLMVFAREAISGGCLAFREPVIIRKSDRWVAHFVDSTSGLRNESDLKPVRVSQEVPRSLLLVGIGMATFKLAHDLVEQVSEETKRGQNKIIRRTQQPHDHLRQIRPLWSR
jgi:hypothetical protein